VLTASEFEPDFVLSLAVVASFLLAIGAQLVINVA
jgi:hypothetical protein